MNIKLFAVAAMLGAFGFASLSKADSDYVSVGNDAGGNPVMMDISSVESSNRGLKYLLFEKSDNDGLLQFTVDGNCAEQRFWVTKVEKFDSRGNKLADSRSDKELFNVSINSPANRGLIQACRTIGAKGY